jgi:flagella basal body P-ring formation protein FlgA
MSRRVRESSRTGAQPVTCKQRILATTEATHAAIMGVVPMHQGVAQEVVRARNVETGKRRLGAEERATLRFSP